MASAFPQQFGKYVLVRKIATGGMAEIFQAKTAGAEGFEKDVVIKRILPHFSADDAFVKMFIDEASITAKLQHANIVQIFDFDVHAGSYYIAMEYIEGQDLSSVLKAGKRAGRPLSVAQCVQVAMELSKGLHYAHTKEHKGRPLNIVHRDISPHNAMISYNGDVKLMDFGIAKAAERSTKTQAGTVKGKVAYMSPEQARGKTLDGRSDLFALATVLWEMLTDRRLFLRNSDFETLTAVLKDDAEPPSRSRDGVDAELDRIIATALAKDPGRRHPTVEAFNRELTRWYYTRVTDLEGERLRPTMEALFAGEIAALRGAAPPPGAREPAPQPAAVTQAVRAHADDGAEPPTRDLGRSSPRVRRRPSASRRQLPTKPQLLRGRTRSRASAPRAPAPAPDEPAMTIEEPDERILAASQATIPPPDSASSHRGAEDPTADPFFSAPRTLHEGGGPSQDEVIRALQEARQGGGTPGTMPDAALEGRRPPAAEPASRTGLIVALALLFLALGGLVAFLMIPE